MKRLKFLPGLVLIILCVGILTAGVFAIQPMDNLVGGQVGVEVSNVPVRIQMSITGSMDSDVIADPVDLRSGTTFSVGDIKFNTKNPNNISDIVISFSITNLATASTNQEKADKTVGAFFSRKSTSFVEGARAQAANVLVEDAIKTGDTTNIGIDLTSYTAIMPQETVTMSITMSIENYQEIEKADLDYKLFIEKYVAETTSDGLVKLPVVSTTTATSSVAGLSSVALASDPELYTTVGVNDIQNKSSIQYVAMPSTITILETGPTTTNIFGVLVVEGGVFKDATNLKRVTLSKNLQTIGDYAFYGCSSLSKINIPDGLLELGRYSFGNAAITQVVLPNTLTKLGDYAFNGCNITSINYDPADENLRYLGNETNPYLVLYDYVGNNSDTININSQTRFLYSECLKQQYLLKSITLPSGLIEIGSYAFEDSAITEINIPEGVTRIGEYAFFSCDLVTAVLPNTLKIIDQFAFNFCSSLNQINIPEGVTTIGQNAFSGCSELTSITIPGTVTTLGKNAFSNCSKLNQINISEGVTTIGQNAFSGCSALTSITIPDSVTSLGTYVVSGCSNLTNLSIGSGVQDTIYKFANCSSITNLTLGYSNITSDYVSAFPNITNLTLKDSVKTIGDSAFASCTSLATVNLGQGVETIGDCAFKGTLLTEISIPASVKKIEAEAFNCVNLYKVNIEDIKSWCSISFTGAAGTGTASNANPTLYTEVNKSKSGYGLYIGGWDNGPVTEIRIPRTVTSLKQYVFVRCVGLTGIYIPNTVTVIQAYPFLGSATTTHLYCECVLKTGETKPSGWADAWFHQNSTGRFPYTFGVTLDY